MINKIGCCSNKPNYCNRVNASKLITVGNFYLHAPNLALSFVAFNFYKMASCV